MSQNRLDLLFLAGLGLVFLAGCTSQSDRAVNALSGLRDECYERSVQYAATADDEGNAEFHFRCKLQQRGPLIPTPADADTSSSVTINGSDNTVVAQ